MINLYDSTTVMTKCDNNDKVMYIGMQITMIVKLNYYATGQQNVYK